jgi:glycosyltransferase involved in cell wall biosynthesis
MKPTEKKVLYIVQLPPPVHGVSAMNKYVVNSPVINEQFATTVIPLHFSKNVKQLEKASLSKIGIMLSYGFRIMKEMIRFRPKLVYFTLVPTGFAFYRDAFYVFILKLFGARIVLHLHGKGIQKQVTGSRFKQKLYSWVFRNTRVICLSPILSKDINQIYKAKPYIVPNGIQVQPALCSENRKTEKKVPQILFLSNYIENKGVLVLLHALALLKEKGYRFRTRLVGAPSNVTVEILQRKIEEYKLTGDVDIVGPLYDEDKYNEFRQADIFAFPTYNDAFPLVNLEAMQFSLPVVTTCEGGIPDIVVDGETGFIVERRNPQMLAEKLALLLDNEILRVKMGKNGYERFMNNFTLQHFEINLKDTLTSILTAC